MAEAVVRIKVGFRTRRALAITEELEGRLWRTKKGDRGALFDRYVKRIVNECVVLPEGLSRG